MPIVGSKPSTARRTTGTGQVGPKGDKDADYALEGCFCAGHRNGRRIYAPRPRDEVGARPTRGVLSGILAPDLYEVVLPQLPSSEPTHKKPTEELYPVTRRFRR